MALGKHEKPKKRNVFIIPTSLGGGWSNLQEPQKGIRKEKEKDMTKAQMEKSIIIKTKRVHLNLKCSIRKLDRQCS